MTLVRIVEAGSGPATVATHRCVRGALTAVIAWVALHVSGVGAAQAAGAAVGLLTLLPWAGPLLGVALAALLAACGPQPLAPLFALSTAAFVTLAGVPLRLPAWLGPLPIPVVAAAALFGGALSGVGGALTALVTSSALSTLLRRVPPHDAGAAPYDAGAVPHEAAPHEAAPHDAAPTPHDAGPAPYEADAVPRDAA